MTLNNNVFLDLPSVMLVNVKVLSERDMLVLFKPDTFDVHRLSVISHLLWLRW